MINFATLEYDLTIHRTEDRSGDEPRLQFAFISHGPDGTEVDIVDTGRLATDFPARSISAAGTRTLANRGVVIPQLPTGSFPYLGVAVRALEEDNSRGSDRRRDRRILEERLEAGLDPIFSAGRMPLATHIWSIANGAPVHDNFGDDDDKIGVSARAYPALGERVDGAVSGTTLVSEDTLSFVEDGAHWDLNFKISGHQLI